jgi:glycosyl transferase family 25
MNKENLNGTGVRIISMASSTERRNDISKQAQGTSCNWSFFDACTGAIPPLSYSSDSAVKRFGRELSNAEIGCYASHYKCWEWLINSNYQQAIIFEDDVLIDWKVIEEISKYNFSIMKLDFVRLFSTHPFKMDITKYRFLSPHYHLVRTKGIVFGTQGYLLTRTAAIKLVDKYKSILMPVDWIPSLSWEHKLANFSFFPFPVIERFVPSTIGDNRHADRKMTASEFMARINWRFRDKIGKIIYEVFCAPKHQLGGTKDVGIPFLSSEAKYLLHKNANTNAKTEVDS